MLMKPLAQVKTQWHW